ncbi:MAG TPA: ROK family protein [Puia sp.]|nr:ROK family protein [Puia sp.]
MQNTGILMGIDLGGTQVRAGLVQNGQLLKKASARIAGLSTEGAVLDRICSLMEELGMAGVSGVGIGVPSIVDVKRGIVYDTVNIPSWKEVYLKDFLEGKYGIPVWVNNDANCFALGEQRYGAGAGCSNLAGVTIGTGLGTGVILDGNLFSGTHCGAGEIGNIGYKDATIETYASGSYFPKECGQSGESLLQRAQDGDEVAKAFFHVYGHHLGQALLMILYAYDPEMIVLGGSVIQSYSFFEKGMRESLAACVFPHSLQTLRIECSRTKDIAIIGASCLAGDVDPAGKQASL